MDEAERPNRTAIDLASKRRARGIEAGAVDRADLDMVSVARGQFELPSSENEYRNTPQQLQTLAYFGF